MHTINCILKKYEFYCLLDLNTKNSEFSGDIYKLYNKFANDYFEKNYTLLHGTREHIKKEFYAICCRASWGNKDTILSFLNICKKNSNLDCTARTGLSLPALFSVSISLISVYTWDLLKMTLINDDLPSEKKIFCYLGTFVICVIFVLFSFWFLSKKPKKDMKISLYKHLVLKEFLNLCEDSICELK